MKFKNPINDYEETSSVPFLWCFLFGVFYFIIKGAWAAAILSFIAVMFTGGLAWIVIPFMAKGIVRNAYLRKGWIEVE